MNPATLSWRDRMQIVNSILFCVVGVALIARYFMNPAPLMTVALGIVFLGFGVYRLALARKEIRKRAGSRA